MQKQPYLFGMLIYTNEVIDLSLTNDLINYSQNQTLKLNLDGSTKEKQIIIITTIIIRIKAREEKAYSELENSYSLPFGEKMITATWASHRTDSSYAFFRSPFLRFENVT